MSPSRPAVWLGAAAILAHFAWVAVHVEPAISGPDAGGYFLQARQIARDGHTWQVAASPLQVVGFHWAAAPDSSAAGQGRRLFSKYPPGFPLLLAVPYALFGPGAALWVDPLLVTLTLVALWLLVRRWLGDVWATAAVVLMAAQPLVNQHALGGFAHGAVACALLWGLLALERWRGGDSAAWMVVCGLAIGSIPGSRYAGALFLPACAVVAARHAWQRRRQGDDRWWAGAALGAAAAALPLGALALRNAAAFGAFWRTGYAASHEQTGFGWAYFLQHWHGYLDGLIAGGGLWFGLGCAGLALWVARPETRERGLWLTGLIGPSTLLYCAYYWHVDGMSQRFLLPTCYLWAVAAVAALQALAAASGRPGRVAAGVVVFGSLLWGLPSSADHLARTAAQRRPLAQVTAFAEERVPAGAVLFVGRGVAQPLDYQGRWRLAQLELLVGGGPGGPGGPGGGRRVPGGGWRGQAGDAPRPMASAPAEAARYRGLRGKDLAAAVRADLVDWAGADGPVYALVDADGLAALRRLFEVRAVAELDLPEPEPGSESETGPGLGPGAAGPGPVVGGMRRPGGPAGEMPGPGFRRRGGPPGVGAPGGPLGEVPSGTLHLVAWAP